LWPRLRPNRTRRLPGRLLQIRPRALRHRRVTCSSTRWVDVVGEAYEDRGSWLGRSSSFSRMRAEMAEAARFVDGDVGHPEPADGDAHEFGHGFGSGLLLHDIVVGNVLQDPGCAGRAMARGEVAALPHGVVVEFLRPCQDPAVPRHPESLRARAGPPCQGSTGSALVTVPDRLRQRFRPPCAANP
jgi:hypothetical protein